MIDAYIAGVALLFVFLGVSTLCDGSLSFFHEHSTSLRTLQAPLLSFLKPNFALGSTEFSKSLAQVAI